MPRMKGTQVLVAWAISVAAVASCSGKIEATQDAGADPVGRSGSASGSGSGSIASEDASLPSEAGLDGPDSSAGSSGTGSESGSESGNGSDSGSASLDQQCAMASNSGSYTCWDCCLSTYASGGANYDLNGIYSTTTIACVCSGPCSGASECGEDDYCVDPGQIIISQACFDCARRAIATGGSCAFPCTGECQSFETCLNGCPE